MKKHTIFVLMMVCMSAWSFGQMRYFQIGTDCGHGAWQDTTFVVAASDQDLIDTMLAELQKPWDDRRFVDGPLNYGDGGFNWNADHQFKWHILPDEWHLAEFAIEVCDGCPYSDLDQDTAYWVGNVKAYCPWSGRPLREIDNPVTDLPDERERLSLRVYPNPAKDKLFVSRVGEGALQVDVYTLLGQRLSSMDLKQDVIEVGSLAEGMYIFRFESSRGVMTKKVWISKE